MPGINPEKLCVQVLASVEHAAPATPTPLVFLQWQSQVHALLAIDTSGKAYSITCQRPSSDAATQAATVSAWVVQLIWDAQTCPGTPAAQTRWSAHSPLSVAHPQPSSAHRPDTVTSLCICNVQHRKVITSPP